MNDMSEMSEMRPTSSFASLFRWRTDTMDSDASGGYSPDAAVATERSVRGRAFSVESFFDPENEDSDVSQYRGTVFFSTLAICMFAFAVGLFLPVVNVEVLPESAMETWVFKSILDITVMDWKSKNYPAVVVVAFTCVILPILEGVGTAIVIIDNFYAKGLSTTGLLSKGTRNNVVSAMCMACSYQVVMFFIPVLAICFFSSGATNVKCGWGFYFYCLFCLISIGMLQGMEMLKEPPDDEGEQALVGESKSLRNRVDSIFPELPGLAAPRAVFVDLRQVLCLIILWGFLVVAGTYQPLLELHIILEGLTLQKKKMSLLTLLTALSSTPEAWPLLTVFVALVFVIPFIYGILLVIAGFVRNCDCCGDVPYRGLVFTAGLLRPWAMTDVFAISIAAFLYSMQGDYLVTTIPAGSLSWGHHAHPVPLLSGVYLLFGAGVAMFFLRWFWSFEQDEEDESYQDVPGLYSERGYEGVSGLYSRPESVDYGTPVAEEPVERPCCIFLVPKMCWCVVAWLLACAGLNFMPYPMIPFELDEINNVLNKTLPVVNNLMFKDLPASYGSCDSMPFPPQPCKEKGVLYHAMDSTKRLTIKWVSGLNTLEITHLVLEEVDVPVNRPKEVENIPSTTKDVPRAPQAEPEANVPNSKHEDDEKEDREHDTKSNGRVEAKEDSQDEAKEDGHSSKQKSKSESESRPKPPSKRHLASKDANATTNKKEYKLAVKGKFRHLGLFLRIEMCDDKYGHGCTIFLDTNSSCCEDNRHFGIEITLKCAEGGIPTVLVSDFTLDTLKVDAHKHMNDVLGSPATASNMVITLPEKDITHQVKETIKSKLVEYLTKKSLVKWGKKSLNLQQLLGRAMHFSAKDKVFQC